MAIDSGDNGNGNGNDNDDDDDDNNLSWCHTYNNYCSCEYK